jgi:hypothetical protein
VAPRAGDASKYRLDSSRIAIIGHSFGWLALLGRVAGTRRLRRGDGGVERGLDRAASR